MTPPADKWAQMRIILIAAGIGVSGSTALNLATPDIRASPWTREDAKLQEERILKTVEQQAIVDHIKMLQNIPPDEVRDALAELDRRLRKVEKEVGELSPDFDWH